VKEEEKKDPTGNKPKPAAAVAGGN